MRVRTITETKIGNAATGEVIYTPPEGERVIRDKLANLERFIYNNQDSLDPLVKLAVLHYQFEAIHPFSDGNGRTGRILNVLYLIECGLLELPVLYLSRYILANRAAYYEGLRRVTEEQAWDDWILFVLRGVEETALETKLRVLAIRKLMQDMTERVKQTLPSIYSKDLVEVLFQQPYARIRFLEQTLNVTRQTASSHLKRLEGIGVLHSVRVRNEVYYINGDFLTILAR
jgi:Fic family protein